MLVLIDESGDAGFKLKKGSSPYFVVSMVVFASFDEAEKCSAAIQALQKECRAYPEFKFHKCRGEIRDKFFHRIAAFDFSVYALAVSKDAIRNRALRTDGDKFYQFFIQQLTARHEKLLRNAHIKIDEIGERKTRSELLTYMRKALKPAHGMSIKFKSSKNDHLIQLADMMAGAIARSYGMKKNSDRWRRMIESKTSDVWEFI